jgi:hypothetical protein
MAAQHRGVDELLAKGEGRGEDLGLTCHSYRPMVQ